MRGQPGLRDHVPRWAGIRLGLAAIRSSGRGSIFAPHACSQSQHSGGECWSYLREPSYSRARASGPNRRCRAPGLLAQIGVLNLVGAQRRGTLLIFPSRPAEWLPSRQVLVLCWRWGQISLPEALEYQVLFPPTGQFPPSRPGKVLSFLAGSQLPPGQGSALVIASCGTDFGGPARGMESAPQTGRLTGIDKMKHASEQGQGVPRAAPGSRFGDSQCRCSYSDEPSFAVFVLLLLRSVARLHPSRH